MRIATLIRYSLTAAIAAWLLFPTVSTAQRCERKATITLDADVYENVPRFITGQGWQGNRIASLPKNTGVYVCREQNVDFGFSTKDWLQIAFKNNKGTWVYGWILKDRVAQGVPKMGEGSPYSPIALAIAAAPPAPRAKTEATTSPDDAPFLPPVSDTGLSVQQASPTSWSDLAVLYGPLFIAVLLGMAAKAAVDWLDAPKARLKDHARNIFIAFLVSPMVFLGFLNAGNFSVTTQTTLVLWLLAFQNGFFWQTVLKRDVGSTQQGG